MTDRLAAAEMWFYRKILRISYIDHFQNEDVLKRMSVKRQLIYIIRKQQMEFFGHIIETKKWKTLL